MQDFDEQENQAIHWKDSIVALTRHHAEDARKWPDELRTLHQELLRE